MKIKILLFLLAVFTAGQCFASDFNDGTLNYTILSGTKNVQVDGLINRSSTTAITIPATVSNGGNTYNVTSINRYAFYFHTGLTSIDLSKATKLQTIGDYAFDNCTAATFKTTTGSPATAVKYDALTIIGNDAFYGCEGLTSFDISGAKSLTSIGENAFGDCTGLTSITIPASVTSIVKYAFYNCTGLTSVDLSQATKLQTIGENAFGGCTAATFITTTGSPVAAVKYNALTSIGDYAFYNCKGLTSFDISGATNLTSIGKCAFYKCTGLTSVTIPASITSIGSCVFSCCSSLTSVTIPASVTSIESQAFYKCSGLTTVDLSKATKLKSIGESAFYNCTGLASITIPASVTSIGRYAFYNCSGLTSITIPASVTSIGEYTFNNCTGLTSVTIPASATSIGKCAFYHCTGLTSIDLSQATKLQAIGESAFDGCTAATFITTTGSPATAVKYNALTSIGLQAFCDCTGLKSFDISGATGLTAIENRAFYNCSGLTSITIPAAVTSIGYRAFYNCTGLKSFDISGAKDLTSIGDYAFENCTGLTTVWLAPMSKTPTLGNNVFLDTPSALKFYVKDGTGTYDLTKYTSATNWSSFATKTFRYLPKTMTATKVATLYLPYEVAIPEGVTAYYCNGKSNTALGMKKLENEVIPANTPVYITSTDAGTFNFLGNGGTDAQPSDIDAALQGTSTDITNNSTTQSDYLALGEKTGSAPAEYGFYRFTGTTIDANTCYVAYSNDAKGLDLSFDGSVTGIKDITNSSSADDTNAPKVIYDLQGRRVNNPQHGIYILNGKKVIIK